MEDPDQADERGPNAAEETMVRFAQKRAQKLGLDWKSVVKQADISRSTEWRLRSGRGSVGSLRAIETKLSEIEESKGFTGEESIVARLQAWTAVGAELLMLDDADATFSAMLKRVRDVVDKKKESNEAMSAITDPLPITDE